MDATVTLAFADADDTPFALAASPAYARDGICFAACSSGLFQTVNAGESWERLEASSESVMTAVTLSPAFARDQSVFAAVKGGVLRSVDGGDTWFTARFPAPPPLFSCLIASPDFERDGFLLAGTLEDGIFSSTDRGARWSAWNFGLFDLNVLCLALSPGWIKDETAYAGTETGLCRSTNGGRAWRDCGFPAELAPALSIACYEDGRGAIQVLVGTESNGLLESLDHGETWARVGAGVISGAVNQLHVARDSGGGSSVYALTNDGVMCSGDQGRNWSHLVRADGEPTAMLPLGDVILLGLRGVGVMRLALT